MGTDIVCACVQVVTILNRIYSQFDRLIETNNVYKVETVGEVYMVVGGCPTRTNTHAQDCVNMALAMMRCVPTLRKECAKIVGDVGNSLNIRIGLNSGPIVAGIVGIKNPRYKLFGDTVRVVCVELPGRATSWCDPVWHPSDASIQVNTASRMESTSEPGRIQISDRTFPYVEGLFKLIPRGPIPVKGKGMMSTYFVDKTSPPVVMSGIVTSGDHSHVRACPALSCLPLAACRVSCAWLLGGCSPLPWVPWATYSVFSFFIFRRLKTQSDRPINRSQREQKQDYILR